MHTPEGNRLHDGSQPLLRPPEQQQLPRPGPLTGVGVCEQRADGQQHLADGERGAPLVLQDVQADAAVAVDVAVVDARLERDLRAAAIT